MVNYFQAADHIILSDNIEIERDLFIHTSCIQHKKILLS